MSGEEKARQFLIEEDFESLSSNESAIKIVLMYFRGLITERETCNALIDLWD